MINASPMLACHGGFDPGPGLSAVIIGTVILWGLALLTAIPNLILSCRPSTNPYFNVLNIGFVAFYVILALLLFTGVAFNGDMMAGIILIFVAPVLAVGHFVYLILRSRRQKRAKQARSGSDYESHTGS